MAKWITVYCAIIIVGNSLPALGDKHSLYYIYTALSKPVSLPGIYDFTALGMLNDREIDFYNSQDQVKVPMQDWMKQKMQEDYWDKGTKSRKSKEQWFKVNVGILMERMDQNNSDLHVLQWRHGCELDEDTSGVHFLKAPPDVYAFAKKSVYDSTKLTLTCMATGFYFKDVRMSVRKYRTSLPDNMLTSSGIRPNDDETYQLKKSLDILENENADYDCYVSHSTLKEPIITKWDGKCNDCSEEKVPSGIIGGVVGSVLTLTVVGVVVFFLKKKVCDNRSSTASSNTHQFQVVNEGGNNGNAEQLANVSAGNSAPD